MTEQQDQDPPDRRALVSAFAGHVSAARSGAGAKILAAVLVAALAAGVVVGVGYLTRPSKKHPATATSPSTPTVTVTPSPTPRPTPAPARTTVAPAPVQTVTVQAAPAPAPTQTIYVPSAPAPAPAVRRKRATPVPSVPLPSGVLHQPRGNFAGVTGYGCGPTAGASFTEHGRWTDGRSGFIMTPTGGPRTSTCDGAFDAMPTSGSATQDDPGNYALWIFHTAPIIHGVCHIDVYIPDVASAVRVGGHPAVYQVFDSAGTSGPRLGSFDIDQVFNRGRWASRHNWRITDGALTIKLLSRGIDWSGNTPTYAHLAISAVSLTCAP